MSTRCQIEFKQISKYINRKKPIIERRTIYRHSDGYPDKVIPDLKDFFRWDNGFDIEYTPANFIYWNKRRCIELLQEGEDDKTKKETEDRWSKLGFGICENEEFHGDIVYFYEVVNEVTEAIKNKFKTILKVLVYKVEQSDYHKPVKRSDLKLIKEEML